MKAFCALLALCLCSCATVKPWQKQVLSAPQMRFSQESDTLHFVEHALTTIEQAEGGAGGSGGGCGCR